MTTSLFFFHVLHFCRLRLPKCVILSRILSLLLLLLLLLLSPLLFCFVQKPKGELIGGSAPNPVEWTYLNIPRRKAHTLPTHTKRMYIT